MALALSADIAVRLLNSEAFATAESGFRRVRAAIDQTSDSAARATRELQMAAFAEKRAMGEARTAVMRREREAVLGPTPAAMVVTQEAEVLAKKAREARTALRELEQFGGKIRNLGIGLTAAITAPFVLLANTAVNAASDVEKAQNKVNIVFGKSAGIISAFSASAAQALGQSRAEALAAAGTFGYMFTNMGIGQEKAAGMSISLVKLASDLASFNKEDPTVMLQKLQSALVGRAISVRRLGLDLSEATVKAKAMQMGIMAVGGALSAQQKIFVRYQLLMDQTADIQGHFAENSDKLANTQQTLAAQYENTAASLGRTLLPIKMKLAKVANDILQVFDNLPVSAQAVGWALGGLGASIGPVLLVGGQLIHTMADMQGLGGLAGLKIRLAETSALFRTGRKAIEGYVAQSRILRNLVMVGGPLLIGLAAVGAAIWYVQKRATDTAATIDDLNVKLGITAQEGQEIGTKVDIAGAVEDVAVLSRRLDELDKERARVRGAIIDASAEQFAPLGFLPSRQKVTMRMGGPEGVRKFRRYYEQLDVQRQQLLGTRRRALGGEDIPLSEMRIHLTHTLRVDPALEKIIFEANEMAQGIVPRRALLNDQR